MADLRKVADAEERDTVSDLPVSPRSPNATYHDDKADQKKRRTENDHHDNVNVDFFDPSGVHALGRSLSRTLSHISAKQPGAAGSASVASSNTTYVTDETFDLEKTLKECVKLADESNIKRRELGVRFDNLRVIGLGAVATYQPTFGSMLNPKNILQTIQDARHPSLRDILSGFYGVVRPGEMLLVLGRPGAGCSSLLRVLANQRHEFYGVEGEVNYDSFTPEQIEKHHRGDVQYCPEDDIHFPTLTVEQTINFAAKTRTPQHRYAEQDRAEYNRMITDIVTTVFGLRHVRDTKVGDAAIRGVSGGEKKRVSISEALATRSHITSWDNSTRGLDASTALEFVQALRIATDIARMSTIVSIYQAGENLYKLFDKVCVIYEGKMAYFGPADRARQYFIDMGYEPANRQTTADFLVSVTDPNGRILRSGFEARAPRNAIEFAEYYNRSESAQSNRSDMEQYRSEFVGKEKRISAYKDSVKAEHAKTAHPKSPYIISIPMQTRALIVRRMQILRGGIALQVIQLLSFIIQAIIMGTVFLQLPDATSAYFSRGGVLFFALLFSALAAMAEIPALFSQRPIVLRQSRAAMYHPFIDSLALTVVDLPITGTTLIIFSIILYFLVGLQRTAGQYFIFLLFIYSMTITMRAWFRTLAAAFRSPAPAQTIAGLAILVLVLYTGYSIPQPSMIGALRWITYINPLKYGFESLIVNEFHTLNGQCSSLVPSGSGYEGVSIDNQVCTTVGSQPGQATVSGNRYVELSFEYSFSHLWRNYGIILGFGAAFIATYLIFTELNTASAGSSSVTLFKRGSKAAIVKEAETEVRTDEEKTSFSSLSGVNQQRAPSSEKTRALADAPVMKDTFSWQRLQYTVPISGGQTRRLLDGVSGYVAPGKLTALMGESGAGKTTLLNVLAQRTSTGVISGDRLVNGHAPPIDFQAQTGYCQQMDTHLPTTTVREALLFSARLRQPPTVPDSEKQTYVEQCLKMCGLEAHADAVVGSLGVEHRKRTTIAVELAAKPRLLLFLDEPTSGLDSQSAWAIVSFLRSLADSGLSILCTIHQPSAELFQVFDRLLLLKKGGQTVYFGDIGHNSRTLIDYFERNGSHKCGDDDNPAEFILSAIGAGATASSEIDWHDAWKRSPEAAQLEKELEAVHADGRSRPPVEHESQKEFATSWTYQVARLFHRDCEAHWRNPTYIASKIALNIVAGLLIGFTFFKAKDSIQGAQNKLFAIFMGLIVSVPLSNQIQVPFIDMRTVYEIRERPSRMYGWTALVTSQIIAEIPWNIIGSSFFFFCWYWTVGFVDSRAGYTYLMICVLNPIYYTTIGQAVAAMSPNAEVAAMLFSLLFSFVLTFNGVLQPFSQLGWWQWMYHVSPYTYLIEGVLGQATGGQDINCAPVELATVNPPSGQTCSQYLQPFIKNFGGYVTNPDVSNGCEYCAFRTTDELLAKNFNIFYSHRWRDVGIFIAFIIFNIFAVFAFTYIFRIRQGNVLAGLKARLTRRK